MECRRSEVHSSWPLCRGSTAFERKSLQVVSGFDPIFNKSCLGSRIPTAVLEIDLVSLMRVLGSSFPVGVIY